MFADLHHLHQFVSLDQGGSVSAVSFTGGTVPGATSIYFGAAHIDTANVSESWLSDDQVSDNAAGVNGPITRSEGMYNGYAAIKADWSDTVFMDNLRGADETGTGVAGLQEVTAANPGNTIHTLSGDVFY